MKLFPMRFCTFFICIVILIGCTVPVFAEAEPTVSAKGAILIEATSGETVFSKNEKERLPMASTTKIMTAIVAIESCDDLSRTVTVDSDACGVEGSSVYLKSGEKLTMEQLLYAVLLESANDAACAVAIEIAGSVEEFADMMNAAAEKIGMTDSNFTNPHGLDDEEHYTTAADMAKLAAYALNNEDFAAIVSTYRTTIPLSGNEGTRLLLNHNKLLKYYDGAIGVKTGFTKRSGRCLVSAAERNGVRLVAVTLSAPNDWNDHKAMLDYGFTKYKHVDAANAGDVCHTIPVTGGKSEAITATNKDSLDVTLAADAPDITVVIEAPRFVYSPVNEGDILGYACYFSGDREIGRLPLYADSSVECKEKPSLWKRILDLYR